MKRFLLCSLSTLVVAIIVVVAVFFFLQYQLMKPAEVPAEVAPDGETQTTDTDSAATRESAAPPVPAGGIPLKTLPLTDAQKSALKTMNIDAETFIITQDMVDCTEASLGAARFSEIINGAAPSFTEGLTLFKCIQ